MGPDVVVLAEPLVDDDLGLPGGGEPFGIQDFAAQGSIEAFVVTVLPWRARVDMDRLDADTDEPFLEDRRCELRAVVGPYVLRLATVDKQRIKGIQDLCRAHLGGNRHG